MRELIIDSFAGGGGASTGIEQAVGRSPDYAINHSAHAIAMHEANHPASQHLHEDVWEVDPIAVCGMRPVGLMWASPDCRHFSRAKGAVPVSKKVRGLAWVVVRWAQAVRPRVIVLENVEEFATWGPLGADGRPVSSQTGRTFRAWVGKLQSLGYHLEHRVLCAADYGAPTTRKRLFLVARCDRQPIVWPAATHTRKQWVPASSIIDWTLPCPSIFGRTRPLAPATLARIAKGVQRFALDPFVVRHGHYSKRTGAGIRPGCGAGTFRGQSLGLPLATVCATNDKHLVVPFITKHYGGMVGHDVERPLGTITAKDHHALSLALLHEHGVDAPTVCDIGSRMLVPHELFAAQGFPSTYKLVGTKTQQTALAGNSVCPHVARALVEANYQPLSRELAA